MALRLGLYLFHLTGIVILVKMFTSDVVGLARIFMIIVYDRFFGAQQFRTRTAHLDR